jgi:hypothetical protein
MDVWESMNKVCKNATKEGAEATLSWVIIKVNNPNIVFLSGTSFKSDLSSCLKIKFADCLL